jgi:TPR repeat protein
LRRGAEEGDVYAQFNMGERYYVGLGVPVDYAEAEKWFRIAAANNHDGAKCE